MKYFIFVVGIYTTAVTATHLHNTDWIIQSRHLSPQLQRRGIIRPQHAQEQSKPIPKGPPPTQKPPAPEPKQQATQAKPTKPTQKTKSSPPRKGGEFDPRVTLDATGPAAMTMAKGSEPAEFQMPPDGANSQWTGSHPTKIVGMVRANDNPREESSQTLKASSQGRGVNARIIVPPGGVGTIRSTSDRGSESRNVYNGMGTLFASSRRPGGANIEASATRPGLVSVHAGNEPNFGDL